MKICIVTVYNSENCGSFWQARALQEYLETRGHQVCFLKRSTRGSSHDRLYALQKAVKYLLRGKPGKAGAMIRQYRAFEREQSVFSVVEECDEGFDVCILGSDTIWNLEAKNFADHWRMYWGACSKAKRTIAYAASAANTGLPVLQKHPMCMEQLKRLDRIGVRDGHTLELVSSCTDRRPCLVCDPTLLQDKAFYMRQLTRSVTGGLLFVYYFGRMPEELQREVRRFAQEQNLKIAVMGNGMKGDIAIDSFTPSGFIENYCAAEFVVTNTFHGTLFSLIFEKPMVVHSCGKEKILDILTRFGIGHQDYQCGGACGSLFRMDCIDYEKVNAEIRRFRESSAEYLLCAIQDERCV